MSSDYTPRKEDEAFALPPVPEGEYEHISTRGVRFRTHSEIQVLDYGHACRAPLIARIAELESLLSEVVSDTAEELGCAADNESILLAADRLRAEVKDLEDEATNQRAVRDALRADVITLRRMLDEKSAEVEKYKADAERYRYLRSQCLNTDPDRMYFSVSRNIGHDWECVDDLDSAIDAAQAQAKEGAE